MPDPVPGSPEHAANMLAKARGITYEEALKQFKPDDSAPASSTTTGASTTAASRPDHIPEKFWDAAKGAVNYDAMAKSYTELERMQTAAHTKTAAETTSAASGALPVIETPTAVDPAVARQAAFQAATAKATDEITKAGKLSDETYKSLADIGYPKDVVDSYVAGQRALQDQYNAGIYSAAGGKDDYFKMTAWAKTNLKPEEINGFNAMLRSGNLEATKIAVSGLKARFESVAGKTATTTVVGGNVAAGVTQGGFNSHKEMIAAMADKRYQSGDPAYHAEVRQKIEIAKRNKVDLAFNIIQGGR